MSDLSNLTRISYSLPLPGAWDYYGGRYHADQTWNIHWTPGGEKGLGQRQTMMWAVERADGGRGLGFTGGHWHRNWAIDDFRRLVLNAILWTAKVEVPETGVVSEPVTEVQLNENLDPKDKMEHVALPAPSDLALPAAEAVEFRWPGKK